MFHTLLLNLLKKHLMFESYLMILAKKLLELAIVDRNHSMLNPMPKMHFVVPKQNLAPSVDHQLQLHSIMSPKQMPQDIVLSLNNFDTQFHSGFESINPMDFQNVLFCTYNNPLLLSDKVELR